MRRRLAALGVLALAIAGVCAPAAAEPPRAAASPAPAPTPLQSAPAGSPGVHALLLNGGSKPAANYLSHLHHLEQMVGVLKARGISQDRIHLFSADGEDPAADLASRALLPEGFWVVEGLKAGDRLRPRTEITDTRWPGVPLRPARRESLEAWFRAEGQRLTPNDWLLLFVTDHGTGNEKDPDDGAISLWEEKLTVKELAGLLRTLPAGVRTVMVMSQCYSGTFAAAIYDGADPAGDICGFFSTARDLKAYGCYPEGQDRDQFGHAFQFIDALRTQSTVDQAHREVLIIDDTPDVPLRTSDLYLGRLLADRAQREKMDVESFTDGLLARAWADRAAWEPEIRLLDRLGDTFGTFSPRRLAEVQASGKDLEELIERMDDYADRWKAALQAVKGENLDGFLGKHPDWRKRLEGRDELDAAAREAALSELLPLLVAHARSGDGTLWSRLEHLREKATLAAEATWRLEVRRAVLRRMRSILEGVAGRVLLKPSPVTPAATSTSTAAADDRGRHGLERLEACESFAPGAPPEPLREASVRRYPPLADEIGLLERVLPPWLGVRFGRLPAGIRSGRNIPDGGTLLQAIYPDSPASEAGLEPGDIVLGPPGQPFRTNQQLREWTMTSPLGRPLELVVLRPGGTPETDQELRLTLKLRPSPERWPDLPGPPEPGEPAPSLPADLEPVAGGAVPALEGRGHLLFFWATWCGPCKAAVPEVLAFAEARGLTAVAITDEEAPVVRAFLEKRREPFFEHVAVDPTRASLIRHGVSGTPTLVLVDDKGIVRHRQVGYRKGEGLAIAGWRWAP